LNSWKATTGNTHNHRRIENTITEQKTEKLSFQEYWENIVGKVAKLNEEIKAKQDELSEFLLNVIMKKSVTPEEETTEQKPSPSSKDVETVNMTLSVPLSKDFYKMIKGLSEITGLSVETMLTDDLFQILTSYFAGGYFDSWVVWAADERQKDDTKDLEKQMEKIRETLF
jgi:hypothetical protein